MPLLSSAPAKAVSGGPDSYGYVWVDSRTPSPIVTYNYIDITTSGSRLTLPDDGCTFEVSLNFQFRFYGTIIDRIYVCSNGFITFAVPDSFFADPPIPDPAAPNSRAVALGIDLNPAAEGSGSVYVRSYPSSTPRRFIIAWDRVYKTYSTQTETFEIILEQNELWKDGRITIQYSSLNGLASTPLAGIENATGSSGLVYPGPLANQLAVAFLPPSDASLSPDQLRVSGSSIAPSTAAQGSADVPMMQLDLSVPTNEVLVKAVEVTLSGLGAGVEDVNKARLWLDNGDGAFTPGPPDVVLAESRFGEVSLVARLSCSLQVTMAASVRAFVSYDLNSTAGIDDWIGARLTGANSISVEYPDTVSSVGLPFDTYAAGVRTRIVASQDTLMLAGFTPLSPSSVAQWATDVPVLSMRLNADQNLVDLSGIDVMLGGGVGASDVWAVKVLRDLDQDRNYTPGTDVVLATGAPSGSPARATLNFFLRVVSGSPETLLIVIDVAPFAILGRVMNVTVSDSGIKLPGGSIDIISSTNFPAAGGWATIVQGQRPTLNLSWPGLTPRPDEIWMSNEYLLDPGSTVPLDIPAGNRVPGYLTAENNATHLFIAIDVADEMTPDLADGVAIGFDTDANGGPTPNADDVFAVNATEGWHLQYNSGAGAWRSIGSCLRAPPTGDILVPSCAAGIGATAFSTTPHRFYEFAIPLAVLGVPLPIPPNTVLRFALAAPPYNGLLAAGNRSTWPLLFAPLPPLTHFGNLVLARGSAPNQPPALDWVGDLGYETDGLDPESGSSDGTFLWRISYSDVDNNPPAIGQPLLHVLRGGVEIAGGPFLMTAEDPSDHDFRDGYVFVRGLMGLQCGGSFSYHFSVRDSRGLTNSTQDRNGPVVYCPDQPPGLLGGTVSPVQGIAGDTFTYRVVYQDAEGVAPKSIDVSLFMGDVGLASIALANMGWIADPDNYSAGAIFGASVILTAPGLNYSYQFNASDNNNTVLSVIFFGPYVLAKPPDLLSVAGVDLAPIMVDEGAQLVPFLQLFLFTSDPDINVTGIRVDRIGTASDTDVDRILMYNDLDYSGTVTGPDQLLGASAPTSGTVMFPVSLQVVQSASTSLILLVDFARPGTADATVGLEVKDSSYVSVESSDYVQSFSTIRSTRALINAPPEAIGLTVDGHAGGTEGISHVRSDAPVLGWQFLDANSGDLTQAAYNVSVGLVSPPTLLWFQNGTGSTSSIAYNGSTLTRSTALQMRVSVSDGVAWSAPAEAYFRLNSPPSVPPPFSPSNGSVDLDPNVTLMWQPATDADGDAVKYQYWISEDEGFGTSVTGTSDVPSVTLHLAEATTHYWRLGATDGWEYAGNATVWHFSTIGAGPPPTRGEVRGRIMGGNAPISGALVELLADSTVVRANVTGGDGVFRILNLDLRLYTVRVSAYGFNPRTLSAQPRLNQSVADLGDIVLTRASGGDGIPAWLLGIVAGLAAGLLLLGILVLFLLRRGRREKGKASAVAQKKAVRPGQTKPAAATQKKADVKQVGKPGEGKVAVAMQKKPEGAKASGPAKKSTPAAAAKKTEAGKTVKPGGGKTAATLQKKAEETKTSAPSKGGAVAVETKKPETEKADEPAEDKGGK